MLTKDAAICIRTVDYSETSQIVSFIAKDTGKISAIAKGAKRPKSPFDGPIEIFSAGAIVFSHAPEKKLATLTEFQTEPALLPRSGLDLLALNCCYFAAELINAMTDEYDPYPELFEQFRQYLIDVGRTSDRPTAIMLLILFQLSLLKEVGLQPILNRCANCKSPYEPNSPDVYFSGSANGLICRDCEPSYPEKTALSRKAAHALSNLKTITEADEKTLNQIEKILVYYFTELLHRPPKMAKHVLTG